MKATQPLCLPILLGVVLALLACQSGPAKDVVAGEYEVKAAFLYNFAKFVDWSDSASKPGNPPFVIAVIGDDPFGRTLDETVQGETVHGRPLVVRRIKAGESVGECEILFISRSENANLEAVLKQLEKQPVLTVSDIPGSAALGVMINFTVVKNSVKMEINLRRVERARLQISSKLLGLAKIIDSEN